MDSVTLDHDRQVKMISVEAILPNRFQPRIKFDEDALDELSLSIKQHGVLSPITVRPLGNKYEIIAGERRYKASCLAGLENVPCLIANLNDKDSAEIALIENVQRKNLTPIEEAVSYKKIFEMNLDINQEQLAKKLGKSQSAIANKLRLLNLSDNVQEALLENKISERHARSLLKIKNKKLQDMMLKKIIRERLTVRRTDEEIINMLNNKDIEIVDFDFEYEEPKTEHLDDTLNRFENLYNLPKTPIIEDKDDEFIPVIPEVKYTDVVKEPLKEEKVENKEVKEVVVPETKENSDLLDKLMQSPSDAQQVIEPVPVKMPEITISKDSSQKLSLEELLKSDSSNVIDPVITEKTSKQSTSKFFKSMDDEEDETLSSLNSTTKFIPQEDSMIKTLIENDGNLKEEETVDSGFKFDSSIFNLGNDDLETENSIPVENKIEEAVLPIDNALSAEIEQKEEVPVVKEEKFVPTFSTDIGYAPSYNFDDLEIEDEQPVVSKIVGEKPSLGNVISTVRNCTVNIEEKGYVVDTEEMDLDDVYQIVIKIHKN